MSVLPRLLLLIGGFALVACSPSTEAEVGVSDDHFDTTTAIELTVGTTGVEVPAVPSSGYRAFRFNGIAGSSVVISARPVGPASASPTIRLFRANLAPIASSEGVLRTTLSATEVHYIEVIAAPNAPTPPPALTIAASAFVPLADTNDPGTVWEFPKTGTESWRALHPRDVDEVWTTGSNAVLHWSGGAGKRYRLADDSNLQTIWAAAANDVWVGGAKLFHFDGTTWFEAVRPAGTTTTKLAGSSADDVWQITYDRDYERQLVRWNGERWVSANTPPGTPIPSTLAVGAPDNAWLFGIVEGRPLHFDGTAWVSVSPAETYFSPQQPARDAVLFADGGLGVIFADTRDGSVRTRDAAGQWKGISSFTGRYPLGLRYGGADLQSLWGTNAAKIWVTQQNGTDVFRRVQTEYERWEAGGEWRNVPSDVRDAFVRGAPDGTAWFAGAQGQLGKQIGDDRVSAVTEPGPACRAIERSASGTVWAACEGTLRKKTGSGWSIVTVPGASRENPIVALWAESPTRVWFATGKGTLAKLDSEAITTLGEIPGARFTSAIGSSETNVFFAATSGLVHWDGNALTNVDLGRADLGPAWMASPADIFVAAGKTVMRFDGTIWANGPELARTVERVSGSSANNVFASSQDDVVHWDGAQWTSIPWKPSLPAECANDAIASMASSGTGELTITTGRGCVGTRAAGAFTWVKRPIVVGKIAVTSAGSIIGAASTGGVVTIQK